MRAADNKDAGTNNEYAGPPQRRHRFSQQEIAQQCNHGIGKSGSRLHVAVIGPRKNQHVRDEEGEQTRDSEPDVARGHRAYKDAINVARRPVFRRADLGLHLARDRVFAHLLHRVHVGSYVGRLQLRAAGFRFFLCRGCTAGLFPAGRSGASAAVGRHTHYLCRRLYCQPHASPNNGESIDVLEFLFLFTIVIAGTGGELCVSRAMKEIGEVHDFRPPAVARFVFRAMRVGWMWAGIALMTLGFFSLLAMLSIENVSFVVPVTALSYAAGTLGALLFLHERISPQRWLGVLIVCIGVTLVWLSRH